MWKMEWNSFGGLRSVSASEIVIETPKRCQGKMSGDAVGFHWFGPCPPRPRSGPKSLGQLCCLLGGNNVKLISAPKRLSFTLNTNLRPHSHTHSHYYNTHGSWEVSLPPSKCVCVCVCVCEWADALNFFLAYT